MTSEINLLEEELELKDDRMQEVLRVIEALLFASNAPLKVEKIQDVLKELIFLSQKEIRALLEDLNQEFAELKRPYYIEKLANTYQLRTHATYAPYLALLNEGRVEACLSAAALEVLAIIAYKQPVTRAEVDKIRGVDSSGSLQGLVERALVQQVGRAKKLGKAPLYGVTARFMEHFGLKSLQDLPKAESFAIS